MAEGRPLLTTPLLGPKEGEVHRAYDAKDVEASMAAHKSRLVFGGLDGIITIFAIMASAAGAGFPDVYVIVLGVANLVADGIAMGLGDYLSEEAEQNFAKYEYRREQWELENYPEGEVQEMIDIYVEKKGFSHQDATDFMNILRKYPKAFLDIMCVDELGFMAPDEDEDFPAWKKGLVTMLAFNFFGAVPVLVYVVALAMPKSQRPTGDLLFAYAAVATALSIFALGVTKASFTRQDKLHSGATMLLNGSAAAGAAYGIGLLLGQLLD